MAADALLARLHPHVEHIAVLVDRPPQVVDHGDLPELCSNTGARPSLSQEPPVNQAAMPNRPRVRVDSYRLVKDFPGDESMRVSHETIYQALYFQARGGFKHKVVQALRSGRTRRKPDRAPDQRTHWFVDPMIMISERPAEIEDRAVPGHWESQWRCQAA